ncbi:MAG: hypothetical protein KF767_07670 [Bdellovibrionaceae bacterium]|nr:hypothetical protein [Pseudobdellovibrionaceae bacterium]
MNAPSRTRIEVCSSCLRALGLITNRVEREAFFERVREKVRAQDPEGRLQIEVGQCQRLCPPDRVTLADSEILPAEPPGDEPRYGITRLGVTSGATEEAVVESILKRLSTVSD